MAQNLIELLIAVIVFAVIAYGMYWICTHFFPSFPPAMWICGAVLLILLILYVSGQLTGPLVPLRR